MKILSWNVNSIRVRKNQVLFDEVSIKNLWPMLFNNKNFDIKKIDAANFSVQANKGTNLNSIFDFFDQEGIEILSMRNETNRLEELFLKLTNNDH